MALTARELEVLLVSQNLQLYSKSLDKIHCTTDPCIVILHYTV